MKKWHWFILSLAVIICDQAVKYWVQISLIPYKPFPIIPMFNVTLAYNSGAAFGFLSGAGDWHRSLFTGFSVLASIILSICLFRTPNQARFLLAGMSLILGGAIGNLIDRVSYGYVIDFIDIYYKHYHFATFNIADSAICIGAGFFILDLFWGLDKTAQVKKRMPLRPSK